MKPHITRTSSKFRSVTSPINSASMVEHLISPSDQLALSTFNPGFKSLFVSGTSSLGQLGSSGSSLGSVYLPPASAPGTAGSTSTAPLSVYDEQTISASPFTGAWSGTSNLRLRRIGKECFVTFTSATTASASAATGTFTNALPVGYRPSNGGNGVDFVQLGRNNNAGASILFHIDTFGNITFGVVTDPLLGVGNFTAAQPAGFINFTFAYAVDV